MKQLGFPVAYSRRTLVFGLAAAVVAVLLGIGITLRSYFDPFDDQSFVQSTWAAATPEARASMARDVIRRLHARMTSGQVQDLLGQPTPVARLPGNVDAYGNRLKFPTTWSYYLGSWSGYGLDDAFLYVHFESDKKVASAEITGG
jgi:hypothetical protein